MSIANIFSSYWSYIHGISESQKNSFLNLNETMAEHRTENPMIYWLKWWNFSRMNILKLQNSISWEYYKWNNAVLFLEQILTWIANVVISDITPGHIIILRRCTKYHYHMLYCSWDMAHDICNCYFSFVDYFLLFYPPNSPKIKKKKKKRKKLLEISWFYTCVP